MNKAVHKQLPNLDVLRAIAVFLVFISHVELQKQELGMSNIRSTVMCFGGMGVTLFFVLSGFLISYLLFQEKTSKGEINIKKFYFRRILRIWPLYFAFLAFAIFVYPRGIDLTAIMLSVFFLSNIAFILEKLPSIVDPIWSLGVEEQFYLFHPHIFRMKVLKNTFNTLIAVFIGLYVIKLTASKLDWEMCSTIMYKARFDCMMLGGIFSLWIVNFQSGNKYFSTLISPKIIFTKWFQIILFSSFLAYLVLSTAIAKYYNDQLMSIFAAFVIGNLALNPNCIVNLKNKALEFVGKISFGFYLLHRYPLKFVLEYGQIFEIDNSIVFNLYVYGTSLILSLIIAYLSYHYYESYFLKLKDKKFSSN